MSDESVEEVVPVDAEKLTSSIEEVAAKVEESPEPLAVIKADGEDVIAKIPTSNPIDLGELGLVAADDVGISDVIDDFDKAVTINSDGRKGQNSYDELQKIQSVQSHLSAGTDIVHDFKATLSFFLKCAFI